MMILVDDGVGGGDDDYDDNGDAGNDNGDDHAGDVGNNNGDYGDWKW